MTTDPMTVYRETLNFTGSLAELHPLKLDRWHRGLLGLPDAICMQYGCQKIYEHIGKATTAIKTMIGMMGEENLPVDPQELARRQVGHFFWYVNVDNPAMENVCCALRWDPKKTSWTVHCNVVPDTVRTVSSFLEGFELGKRWVSEIEQPSSKSEE